MGAKASEITSITIVYLTVNSGADERKHQSSVSLAFVRGIHLSPVNSWHQWSVTRKLFPFDDVIMCPKQMPHYNVVLIHQVLVKSQDNLIIHLPGQGIIIVICAKHYTCMLTNKIFFSLFISTIVTIQTSSVGDLGLYHHRLWQHFSIECPKNCNMWHMLVSRHDCDEKRFGEWMNTQSEWLLNWILVAREYHHMCLFVLKEENLLALTY